MRKKIAGTVCVVCLVALVALLALWVAPIMVQVDSVTQTKETFYREATVSAQKAAIQKPGVIDFAPLKSKSVLPFLKTKACVATVKKVETLYKKDSQENTYQACNLVELKVVKNIAGGFQKGESVYVFFLLLRYSQRTYSCMRPQYSFCPRRAIRHPHLLPQQRL